MRIKEGDKWKVAFTMPIGLYEPTIIFFSLTNSLATFQTMINNILRKQINTGKVTSFIDNILAGTDVEEEHDEVVEEVLKKIEKNYLYMKPKKYVWKSRRMNFLGVELGLEEVWMENKKMKEVTY